MAGLVIGRLVHLRLEVVEVMPVRRRFRHPALLCRAPVVHDADGSRAIPSGYMSVNTYRFAASLLRHFNLNVMGCIKLVRLSDRL